MTLDEIRREAATLSEEERVCLRAFLKHLERVNNPESAAALSRLNVEIGAGRYHTLEELEEMDARLTVESR